MAILLAICWVDHQSSGTVISTNLDGTSGSISKVCYPSVSYNHHHDEHSWTTNTVGQ